MSCHWSYNLRRYRNRLNRRCLRGKIRISGRMGKRANILVTGFSRAGLTIKACLRPRQSLIPENLFPQGLLSKRLVTKACFSLRLRFGIWVAGVVQYRLRKLRILKGESADKPCQWGFFEAIAIRPPCQL